MTTTHSAADLRGISLANVARWDGGPSKTSQIVSFFPIENCLSIASRAARGLGTPAENAGFEPRPVGHGSSSARLPSSAMGRKDLSLLAPIVSNQLDSLRCFIESLRRPVSHLPCARRSMILFTVAVLAACASPLTTPLRGTVVDPEGKPVAGATVWLVEGASAFEAHVVAEGRSDERGGFSLEQPIDLADEYRIDRAASASSDLPLAQLGHSNGQVPQRAIALGHFGRACRSRSGSLQEACRARTGWFGLCWALLQIRRFASRIPNCVRLRVRVSKYLDSRMTCWRFPSRWPIASSSRPMREGCAVLDAFAAERVAELEVAAEGHGTQRCAFLFDSGRAQAGLARPGRQGFGPAHGR